MKNREAFAGIDVAIAKRKRLPVVVCVREEDTSPPPPLRAAKAGKPALWAAGQHQDSSDALFGAK